MAALTLANPYCDGSTDLLLSYQKVAVKELLKGGVINIQKGRRIGFSWVIALWAAFEASLSRSAGGRNTYYMGYEKDMARTFIRDAAAFAKLLNKACSEIQEEVLEKGKNGDDEGIAVFRIVFASGFEVVALSSCPRNFRSRQGNAIIDEAAFHDDPELAITAALALRIWGGTIVICSTHNGEANPFNRRIQATLNGDASGRVLTIPFRDAVAQGLGRRVFAVARKEWSEEAERAWVDEIYAEHGDRASEELDCIPRAGNLGFFDRVLVDRAAHDHAGDPTRYMGGHAYGGNDIARYRDQWAAMMLERVGRSLWLREETILVNQPWDIHDAAIKRLMDNYKVLAFAFDQTGIGNRSVWEYQRLYGSRAVGLTFTPALRLEMARALRTQLERDELRIPVDIGLKDEFKLFRLDRRTGDTPRLVINRQGNNHADRVVALMMAVYVATGAAPPAMEYQSVSTRREWALVAALYRSPHHGIMRPDHSGDRRNAKRWGWTR